MYISRENEDDKTRSCVLLRTYIVLDRLQYATYGWQQECALSNIVIKYLSFRDLARNIGFLNQK